MHLILLQVGVILLQKRNCIERYVEVQDLQVAKSVSKSEMIAERAGSGLYQNSLHIEIHIM